MLKLWRGASSSNQLTVQELKSASVAPTEGPPDLAITTDNDKDDRNTDITPESTSAVVESEGSASSDVVQSVEPANEPAVEVTDNVRPENDEVTCSNPCEDDSR